MIWIAGTILTIFSAAFVFALLFGKPSKDEPMNETPVIDLDEFEVHWTKKTEL